MPAARKKSHKSKSVKRSHSASRSKSIWQQHPNLKLLLAVLALVVVAYLLSGAMMYAQS